MKTYNFLINKIRNSFNYLASFTMEIGLLHPNYQKLVIVTTGRTGSTMLIDCLNQHPEIQMYYEVFSHESEATSPRWRKLLLNDPIRYLHYRVYKYHPPRVRVVGFKIHYYHCQGVNQSVVWDYLAKSVDKVIHLKRNLVETYVSSQFAQKYQTWHVYEEDKLNYMYESSLHINPTELCTYLEEKTAKRARFDQLFAGKDVLEVWYKNLNENIENELLMIQNWLDLTPVEMHPISLKQNTRRLDELITNYTELQTFFRNTEWISFFN